MGLNRETKDRIDGYDTVEEFDDIVKEQQYRYFTTFRKYYKGEGYYLVTLLNWEIAKMTGELKEQLRIPQGFRTGEK